MLRGREVIDQPIWIAPAWAAVGSGAVVAAIDSILLRSQGITKAPGNSLAVGQPYPHGRSRRQAPGHRPQIASRPSAGSLSIPAPPLLLSPMSNLPISLPLLRLSDTVRLATYRQDHEICRSSTCPAPRGVSIGSPTTQVDGCPADVTPLLIVKPETVRRFSAGND